MSQPNESDGSMKLLERSLELLKTDHIDLRQRHNLAPSFNPLNETQMAELEERTEPVHKQALFFRRS